MMKQVRTLLEIGIVYLAISMVLDYFLSAYQIVLWSALAFEFILFSIMILSSLWECVPPTIGKRGQSNGQPQDQLTRLEHLCKIAIDQGDQAAQDLLSERVRSLTLAAAANNLNISETALRTIAYEEPDIFQAKIRDPELFKVLTTKASLMRRGDTKGLESLLEKIEEWTT